MFHTQVGGLKAKSAIVAPEITGAKPTKNENHISRSQINSKIGIQVHIHIMHVRQKFRKKKRCIFAKRGNFGKRLLFSLFVSPILLFFGRSDYDFFY